MIEDKEYFTTVDWALFAIFVILSLTIGCRRKQTPLDYVLAERKLGAFPVAMSLIASFWSAIAILGYSAESYFYGTMFWMTCFGNVLGTIATAHLFIPKLRSSEIESLYDYLRLRFNVYVKIAASICFICQTTLYLGVVIYAPSKALNQVTGLNIWLPASLLTLVCIAYSTLGGVRGVVWSDVFQFLIILTGLLLTAILGSNKVDGFWNVLKISIESDRLEFFDFDVDPRIKLTVWSTVIGHGFTTISLFSFNQIQVQRYLSIKNDALCKRAAWLNCLGIIVSISVCIAIGLIMYTYYEGCDPLTSSQISSIDQLYPLFIMTTMKNLNGFGGLFLATIFSGTLSTISSCLNSLSAVVVNDLIKPTVNVLKIKFNHYLALLRIITVLFGVFALLMVLIVQNFQGVLIAALSIFGVFNGPVMGVYVLGFFVHFCKPMAALIGLVLSLSFQIWILAGSIIFSNPPFLTTSKPTYVTDSSGLIAMYGMSFLWYGLSGCVICVLVGILASIVQITFEGFDQIPEKKYRIDWISGLSGYTKQLISPITAAYKRILKKENPMVETEEIMID